MPYPSTAIANAFLSLPEVQAIGGLTQMQLQKLVYMAHGWNMAINGERLVDSDPEAWTYGPVFPDLYQHTKFLGTKPIDRLLTPEDNSIYTHFRELLGRTAPLTADLSDRERAVIENVWSRYGRMSGPALSRLTHQPSAPWFKAYARGKSSPITEDLIKPHYEDLLDRAEQAAQAHN